MLRLATERQINQKVEDLSKNYQQHPIDLISKHGDIVAFLRSEFALSLGEKGHSILAFFLLNWLSIVLVREGGVQDQGIQIKAIHMAMDIIDEENSAFLAKRQKMPSLQQNGEEFLPQNGTEFKPMMQKNERVETMNLDHTAMSLEGDLGQNGGDKREALEQFLTNLTDADLDTSTFKPPLLTQESCPEILFSTC